MSLKLKYPQQFKKQHKKRITLPVFNPTYFSNKFISITSLSEVRSLSYACYTLQNIILPKKFISFLRKFLRKFFKRHQVKCWFRIQLNKVISSKSKNSRMGRGVGTMNRMSFAVRESKPLFIISNISARRICLLKKFLAKRLPIALVYHHYSSKL